MPALERAVATTPRGALPSPRPQVAPFARGDGRPRGHAHRVQRQAPEYPVVVPRSHPINRLPRCTDERSATQEARASVSLAVVYRVTPREVTP